MFGGAPLGDVGLGSILNDSGVTDTQATSPLILELNGVDSRHLVVTNTVKITDTIGQPVTASFTLLDAAPQVGDRVRVLYFSFVLFAGLITRIEQRTPDLRTMLYACECQDWSQILLRRKLRRNFTNVTVQAVDFNSQLQPVFLTFPNVTTAGHTTAVSIVPPPSAPP